MIVRSQALIVGHPPVLPHLLRPSKPAKNQIIVMQDGCVVAIGSNEELLQTCDLYRRLHNLQFGEEVTVKG